MKRSQILIVKVWQFLDVSRIYEILLRITALNISLNDDANSLKEEMKQINEDLKSIVKECEADTSVDKSICSALNSTVVTTKVNFTFFPDTSNQLKAFKDALENNITAKISEV